MSKKITTEEYKAKLQKNNPNVELLGEFINYQTNILCHCKKHNNNFINHPTRVMNGVGCPQCSKENHIQSKTKTHEWYLNELKIKNPTVIPIDKYIGIKTPILHKCLIHNIEWSSIPSNILKGCGCHICLKERIGYKNAKTNNEYLQELQEKGIKIIPLEKYQTSSVNILHKCLICGYEWKVRPANVLSNKGCPNCCRSKGEDIIEHWLNVHHIKYITQMKFDGCKAIRSLPFDFFLVDYNKCIEFDGKQHFESVEYFGGQKGFENRKQHDYIKNEYCKNNNIPLLRIPYYANVEEELEKFLA